MLIETEKCEKDDWIMFKGICYWHMEKREGITWRDAAEECKSQGGSLVRLLSEDQVKFIHTKLINDWNSNSKDVHIGNFFNQIYYSINFLFLFS